MSHSPQPRPPILSAAAEVFATRGYANTTAAELRRATGLDAASFHVHLGSPEGCFLRAYDRIVAAAHASICAALPEDAPWPDRLAAGLLRLFELLDANPAAARLVLVESEFAGQAALKRYTATLENFAPFIHEGRQCSTAPEQLPPILDSVLPAGVAFSLRCQLLSGEPALDLYPELLRLLLAPYLGDEQTTACIATHSVADTAGARWRPR